MKKIIILLSAFILYGCGATNNKPIESEVLSFNGHSGIIRVDAPRSGLVDFPALEANKYCLNLKDGYGIKNISFMGQQNYSFSCNIKTLEEANASPPEKTAIEVNLKKQKSSKSFCTEFGFKIDSLEFSKCVLQMELARQQTAENEERYRLEQEAYERRVAEIEREKQRRRGAALMELGGRIMGGQPPINALGSMGAGTPIAPSRPNPINQTITLPNGRMINCSSIGTMTNCF